MELIQENPDLSAYLAADEAIDHHHPLVRATAARLAEDADDSYAYARLAFEFVRDTIPHSQDAGDPRVTWRASDVLEQGTGICYAKAHALAALLRAEDIPTALCYQRFAHDEGDGYAVHGLVAVRFKGPGTARTRVATSRAWTRGSRWTASDWPSRPTPGRASWTTPVCTRHPTRPS